MSEIYTFIDFETTGLDYMTDQIIEIGAVKTDFEREYGRLQMFVRLEEGRELSQFTQEFTGITTDDLRGGHGLVAAARVLDWFMYGTTLVAHNASFELAFLSTLPVKNTSPFICTRALSKIVEPTESASLANVCSRHSIDLTGHHRAMNDVLATIEVLRKFKPLADAHGLDYRNTIIKTPDRAFTYVPQGAKLLEVA